MSEQAPKNNPDYLQQHPKAEQNPDRAYEMAHASKDYEQHLPKLRKDIAETALKLSKMTGHETNARSVVGHLEDRRRSLGWGVSEANKLADEAGKKYDVDQALNEAHENGAEFLDLTSDDFTQAFAEAPVYRKSTIVKARSAEAGEVVVTVTPDGVEEGRNTAGEGDHVVTGANGADFILPAEKFNKLYEATEDEGTFQAKGTARIIDNPTGKKIGILAPWGEMQYGDAEAKLAVQYDPANPDVVGTDRYVLDSNEFAVYKEVEQASV
ncbi:MAG: hypothetical protein JWO61_429 [Candidatus Saccharibacteria bacterium]|nr:hypothetical protein [Candidatus Saccharibacteria bacterium]